MTTVSERIKALASWGWKREGLPSWALFDKPYLYPFADGSKKITIHQSKATLGSTVWDSSIVLSKFFEKKEAASKDQFHNSFKSAIELGAGCGLVGVVLSHLGVDNVVLTDMGATMEILRKNAKENAPASGSLTAEELEWGKASALDGKKFDLIVATDTMYTPEAIPALILCMLSLAHDKTEIYFAYGRNSYAEADFYRHLKIVNYMAERLTSTDLDEVYQSPEIKVIKIRRRQPGEEGLASYEGDPVEAIEPSSETQEAEAMDQEEEQSQATTPTKRIAKRRKRNNSEEGAKQALPEAESSEAKKAKTKAVAKTESIKPKASEEQEEDKQGVEGTAKRTKMRRERRKALRAKLSQTGGDVATTEKDNGNTAQAQKPMEKATSADVGKHSSQGKKPTTAETADSDKMDAVNDGESTPSKRSKGRTNTKAKPASTSSNATSAASSPANKSSKPPQRSPAAPKRNAGKPQTTTTASTASDDLPKAQPTTMSSPAQGKGKRKRKSDALAEVDGATSTTDNLQQAVAQKQNKAKAEPATKRQKLTQNGDNDDDNRPLEQSSAPPSRTKVHQSSTVVTAPAPKKTPQIQRFEPRAEPTPAAEGLKEKEASDGVSPAVTKGKRKRPQTPTASPAKQAPASKKQQPNKQAQQPAPKQTGDGAAIKVATGEKAGTPTTPSATKTQQNKQHNRKGTQQSKQSTTPSPLTPPKGKAQEKRGGPAAGSQTPTTPAKPKPAAAPRTTPNKTGESPAATGKRQNNRQSPGTPKSAGGAPGAARRGQQQRRASEPAPQPKQKLGSAQRRRMKLKQEKEEQAKAAVEKKKREDRGELIESEVVAPSIVF